MDQNRKLHLLKQIIWDYSIPVADIEKTLEGKIPRAGHFSQSDIFKKLLESYSWFTILQIMTPSEISGLLTTDLVKSLRTPSLRKNYEFLRKRLQETLPVTG